MLPQCGARDQAVRTGPSNTSVEIEAVVDCFTVDAILKSPVIDIIGRDTLRRRDGGARLA